MRKNQKTLFFLLLVSTQISLDDGFKQSNLTKEQLQFYNFEQLLHAKCRLAFNVVSPTEFLGYPTEFNATFRPFRFQDIDNVAEIFAISASLNIEYFVPCGEEVNNEYPGELAVNFDLTPVNFWRPPLDYEECYQNCDLETAFSQKVAYIPGTRSIRTSFVGKFESQCDLELRKFPFDRYREKP